MQAEPGSCRQRELTFGRELSLRLVQFILKHSTDSPIRKQPAEKLSPYLKDLRGFSAGHLHQLGAKNSAH